jgi:fructose-1,6-bisphosphatase/inositol monophosphatase family enzyme
MKRWSTLAAGLLIGAAALQFSGVASGQSDGWITLLDNSKMGEWDEVGKANWAMKDGALVADKLDGKDLLLSRQQDLP